MRRAELYDAWAACLVYPDSEGAPLARAGLGALLGERVTGGDELALLGALLAGSDAGPREEVYTRTFDGSEDHALELGWHLHGENYARGALLVRLRKLLREQGLTPGAELADHLGVVLGLLGRVEEDVADALARTVVLPALQRLLAGFGDDEASPYRGALTGVHRFLQERHAAASEGASA